MKNFGHLCVMLLQLLLAMQTIARLTTGAARRGFAA